MGSSVHNSHQLEISDDENKQSKQLTSVIRVQFKGHDTYTSEEILRSEMTVREEDTNCECSYYSAETSCDKKESCIRSTKNINQSVNQGDEINVQSIEGARHNVNSQCKSSGVQDVQNVSQTLHSYDVSQQIIKETFQRSESLEQQVQNIKNIDQCLGDSGVINSQVINNSSQSAVSSKQNVQYANNYLQKTGNSDASTQEILNTNQRLGQSEQSLQVAGNSNEVVGNSNACSQTLKATEQDVRSAEQCLQTAKNNEERAGNSYKFTQTIHNTTQISGNTETSGQHVENTERVAGHSLLSSQIVTDTKQSIEKTEMSLQEVTNCRTVTGRSGTSVQSVLDTFQTARSSESLLQCVENVTKTEHQQSDTDHLSQTNTSNWNRGTTVEDDALSENDAPCNSVEQMTYEHLLNEHLFQDLCSIGNERAKVFQSIQSTVQRCDSSQEANQIVQNSASNGNVIQIIGNTIQNI
ncbi:uncharacterized protein LOC106071890 [Biomphalaria glabrata]|uniref:Uncharacterized protein LOC106071890 n=1 Tax=Biomphalaria glabrata TaxID=6526 RepID=A0A9W2ZEJ7_BIOGL|nr:uncharacterized protein LOC106071890 [Biomphalaria glabrata]XP_055873368.1 uncharacterized protein LOC106071890 [Biomphalaria glabrata]KAI8785474.1 hypothetical protein BgiBS90_012832 [Biomphalaria glabrata]